MIGLKRGTVKLVAHDKTWSKLFEQEKKKLASATGNIFLDIQHIGSTAIPGIKAKPIIDMLAGIAKLKDADKLIKPLNTLGYKFYRKSGHEIFFAKGSDEKRTHYLHVVRYGGAKWRNDLFFRNHLISHLDKAKQYEKLKTALSEQHANDRNVYTERKNNFIKQVLQSDILIRKATAEDLPRVSYVTNIAYKTPFLPGGIVTKPHQKDLKENFLNKQVEILVAVSLDKVVGAIKFKKVEGSLYLYQMAVLGSERGKGIGTKLIQAVEKVAQQRHIRKVTLDCMEEKQLPSYYAKLGYKKDRKEKQKNYHIVFMSKTV